MASTITIASTCDRCGTTTKRARNLYAGSHSDDVTPPHHWRSFQHFPLKKSGWSGPILLCEQCCTALEGWMRTTDALRAVEIGSG
jgi:hypothetical protein